jgi:hypothetical protein
MRVFAVVLLALVHVCAQAWPTPKRAIDEWLSFELSGGRLQGWVFSRYFNAPANYDEPGWDMVHAVRSAKAENMQCASQSCTAKLVFVYEPTKPLKAEALFEHPTGGSEAISVKLTKVQNEWLLEPITHAPCVAVNELKRRGIIEK